VIGRLDLAKRRRPQGGNGDRVGIVRVVLVGSFGGQHPDARGQGGRHIEDLLPTGHQLLGQQVSHAAHRLDGPGALLKRLCPRQELVDLTSRRPHLDAGNLILVPPYGHRSVRCLVGVDPDHHIHEYLLGLVETTGALLLMDCSCSILF